MREIIKETIKRYEAILPCQDFIVTGSYVTNLLLGLPKGEIGDLDIILVNPDTTALEALKRLQESLSPELASNPIYPIKMFRIKDSGIKIDFFLESTIREFITLQDGTKVSPILDIVKAKKSYNRMKDWVQLRKMAKLFFIESEFQSFLDK